MSRWADLIPRQEHTNQQRSPRRAPVSKFIIHIAEGSYEGTISWQQGSNEVSSHFITGRNSGELCQMVDTSDEAWTQAAGNPYSLSSENAGFSGDTLTDWQIEKNAQLYARAHKDNPKTLPLRLMQGPDEAGLGYHALGGDIWGGHFDCPGIPIVDQLPMILDRTIDLCHNLRREDSFVNVEIPKLIALHADGSWSDPNASVPLPLFAVGTGPGQWGNAWVRFLATGIARVRVVYNSPDGWTGVSKDLTFAGESGLIPLPTGCDKVYIGRVEGDPLTAEVTASIRYDR